MMLKNHNGSRPRIAVQPASRARVLPTARIAFLFWTQCESSLVLTICAWVDASRSVSLCCELANQLFALRRNRIGFGLGMMLPLSPRSAPAEPIPGRLPLGAIRQSASRFP